MYLSLVPSFNLLTRGIRYFSWFYDLYLSSFLFVVLFFFPGEVLVNWLWIDKRLENRVALYFFVICLWIDKRSEDGVVLPCF